MASIIFNGSISDEGEKLFSIQSPGLLFGEGIFETLLVKDGRIFLEELHWQRLITGFEKLGLKQPLNFSMESLSAAIIELAAINELSTAKARVTALRHENGETDLVIQTVPFTIAKELNKTGLQSGIFSAARKQFDGFANLKHNNYLPYRMARRFAGQSGWDEPIILNDQGHICEAGIYNIFIIKDGQIFTPPLSAGCVAGTLRQHLLNNFTILEKAITVEELLAADEIMMTNAIQLMQWVKNIGNKNFKNKIISTLFDEIKARNAWLL